MRIVRQFAARYAAVMILSLPFLATFGEDAPPVPPPASYGPQTDEERAEAELIRQEDEREKQKWGELRMTTEEGKIFLPPEVMELKENALPWAIGRYSTKNRVYLLLLDSTEFFNQLKALNGKSAKLSGRIRLDGKYFIATSVYVPLNVPSSPPKPGGM